MWICSVWVIIEFHAYFLRDTFHIWPFNIIMVLKLIYFSAGLNCRPFMCPFARHSTNAKQKILHVICTDIQSSMGLFSVPLFLRFRFSLMSVRYPSSNFLVLEYFINIEHNYGFFFMNKSIIFSYSFLIVCSQLVRTIKNNQGIAGHEKLFILISKSKLYFIWYMECHKQCLCACSIVI